MILARRASRSSCRIRFVIGRSVGVIKCQLLLAEQGVSAHTRESFGQSIQIHRMVLLRLITLCDTRSDGLSVIHVRDGLVATRSTSIALFVNVCELSVERKNAPRNYRPHSRHNRHSLTVATTISF